MKQIILLLVTFFTLFSCIDERNFPNNFYTQSSDVFTTYPEDIEQNSVLPEIENYFENITRLAKWYALHPLSRNLPLTLTRTDQVNTVLQKLESIILVDSTGSKRSIFDLSDSDLQQFLKSWKAVESNELSQKLKKDTTKQSVELFINRNAAFNETFGNLKSVDSETEDPFFKVKAKLDEQEKEAILSQPEFPTLKSEEYSDDNFWATVLINNLLSFSVIQYAPNILSPQTFVDHLRPGIKRGRILIALPGGWSTSTILVLYPNKVWYDFGHVAVITKNQEEIPDTIDDKFNFTIGSGVKGTLREEVGWAWCHKHGLSFLGQVCEVKWEVYKNESKKWRWRKVTTDIDNELFVNEVEKYLGVPYCNVIDVFFSKWVAPKSFICSSLAWYCVKEKTGLNISDWWSPTVYPRELYFSENIRIVDDTLE